jgi:hypothetical protein
MDVVYVDLTKKTIKTPDRMPDDRVELSALWLHIQEALGSNIGTENGYPD